MNRESIRAGYAILVGMAILGLWGLLYATDQIPELETAPLEIGYHLAAEILTAIVLLTAGVGLFRRRPWAQGPYPVALGMVLYTVINSAGYYAQLGDTAMVGLFTVLTAVTLVLLVEYVCRVGGAHDSDRGWSH